MNGLHELSNIYDIHLLARPMLSSAIFRQASSNYYAFLPTGVAFTTCK